MKPAAAFIALIKNQSDSNDYLWGLATRVSNSKIWTKKHNFDGDEEQRSSYNN